MNAIINHQYFLNKFLFHKQMERCTFIVKPAAYNMCMLMKVCNEFPICGAAGKFYVNKILFEHFDNLAFQVFYALMCLCRDHNAILVTTPKQRNNSVFLYSIYFIKYHDRRFFVTFQFLQ